MVRETSGRLGTAVRAEVGARTGPGGCVGREAQRGIAPPPLAHRGPHSPGRRPGGQLSIGHPCGCGGRCAGLRVGSRRLRVASGRRPLHFDASRARSPAGPGRAATRARIPGCHGESPGAPRVPGALRPDGRRRCPGARRHPLLRGDFHRGGGRLPAWHRGLHRGPEPAELPVRRLRTLDTSHAAATLIHEALHYAGLTERPSDPRGLSTNEINRVVRTQCGL